jgi:hypothetical protein
MNSKVVVRNDKQEMYCCGDASQMAFWDPLTSLPMTSSDQPLWVHVSCFLGKYCIHHFRTLHVILNSFRAVGLKICSHVTNSLCTPWIWDSGSVSTKITVFWDITPRSPSKVNGGFGGTHRLQFQSRRTIQSKHQLDSCDRWIQRTARHYVAYHGRQNSSPSLWECKILTNLTLTSIPLIVCTGPCICILRLF